MLSNSVRLTDEPVKVNSIHSTLQKGSRQFLRGMDHLLLGRLLNTGPRPTMGGSLEHHPFSGPVHSALKGGKVDSNQTQTRKTHRTCKQQVIRV